MKGDGLNVVLRQCELKVASNPGMLAGRIADLVLLTKMRRLGAGDAQQGSDGMPGCSLTQIIETSHIAIHGFEISNVYIVTIVSCKEFDVKKVVDYLLETFRPKSYSVDHFKVDTIYPVTKNGKES